MEVCLDIIFIENAIIDLFLMLVTWLLRLKYRKDGIYIAAIIGEYIWIGTIVGSAVLSSTLLKIIVAIIMIILSLKEKF